MTQVLTGQRLSHAPRRAAPAAGTRTPPVIILGGGANALSVARSLGGRGIKVYALNGPDEHVCYSRHCEWLPVPIRGAVGESWTRYLTGRESDPLRGAILLACSDTALEMIARHRPGLEEKFLLDESNPRAQLCMLNKLCTYQQARLAGVVTPRFWLAEDRAQVVALKDELVFPLLVKPLFTHQFEKYFPGKFFVADNFDHLVAAFDRVAEARVETMLVEKIPGPDDRSCSYYTYLDENSEPLFHFTKRNLRRYPLNEGGACYHITDWVPEVIEPSLRLFRQVGLRGLAHVEYKKDDRDGRLKLIECNARFTAANCLVAASGFDLARFVYNRLTGRPQPPLENFTTGLRLWDPLPDFRAFLQLRRRGEMTLRQWLASVMHPQLLTFFRWSDPWPSLVKEVQRLKQMVFRRVGRLFELGRR